jgi:ribosomal protein S27AE
MRFTIPKGTKCKIRGVGEQEWKAYFTKKVWGFDKYELSDNGGTWTFRSGGVEMKVATCFVEGRGKGKHRKKGEKETHLPPSVCRDCGASTIVPRHEFIRSNRPRCSKCGGTLDYQGDKPAA